MDKQRTLKIERRPRLVVYVSPEEHKAITKDAKSIGFKNAHQWANAKLAQPIREACERK